MHISIVTIQSLFLLVVLTAWQAEFSQAEELGLSECITLVRPNDYGTQVVLRLFRDEKVLPQFYRQEGHCRKLVRTRSVVVNGVCTNIELYSYEEARYKRCLDVGSQDRNYRRTEAFRRCNWTKKNVRLAAIVNAHDATLSSLVLVKLYTQENCSGGWIAQGTFTVTRSVQSHETDDFSDSNLESCVMLINATEGGDKVVMTIFRDQLVLPHLYEGRGHCRKVVHADSVSVNGVCTNLDLHEDRYEDLKLCRRKFPIKSAAFKRCFWNRNNVSFGGPVNATGAFFNSDVIVTIFDFKNCSKRLAWGKVRVQ